MAGEISVNPLRSLQFGLNSLYTAMRKTNVGSIRESSASRQQALQLTPGEIGHWNNIFKIDKIPNNARERYLDIRI